MKQDDMRPEEPESNEYEYMMHQHWSLFHELTGSPVTFNAYTACFDAFTSIVNTCIADGADLLVNKVKAKAEASELDDETPPF